MGFDFLRDDIRAASPVSAAEAEELAAGYYGLEARALPLGSQQDTNFLLVGADEAPLGVLKIANAAFGPDEVDAQDEAADVLAATCSDLRFATALRRSDRRRPILASPEGPRLARVLRYLPGGTLTGPGYLAPDVVAGLGRVAGRVSAALAGFRHPGLDRVLQWDPRYADEVLRRLGAALLDRHKLGRVLDAGGAAWEQVGAVADALPHQCVHLDLTDDNVVRTGRTPDGVIDFGDLTTSWAVAEPAITISSVLHHAGAEPASVLPAVRAFHAVRPLSVEEAQALWPVVVLRAAVIVVSGHFQAAIDGENAYAVDALEHEWRMFEQATAVPTAVMTALIRDALGMAAAPHVVSGALLSGPVRRLPLGVDADAMDAGAWQDAELADRLAAGCGGGSVATEYGRPRPTGTPPLSPTSPATVPTGVDLWTDADLRAPWAGRVVEAGDGRLVLVGDAAVLTVTGVLRPLADQGTTVAAAAPLAGTVGGRVHVGVRRVGVPEPPPLVRPEYAAGWRALTADPAPLLGLPPTAFPPDDLLARRAAAFATVQEHYYADPPRIERGWRHFLLSADGRSYLDMVNNVAVVGHAHPRVEAAAARQLRRLNTNSRFHYAAVVELAERLTALLPDPLDTVFLVNSGSEAVDLALRLALAATGRRDVVAVREAYHGWTYLTDAVSTSVADNPAALTTRPEWVHPVPALDRRAGDDPAAAVVAVIDDLAAAGRAPAAFVAEAFFGNAGGIPLPDGYLAAVYAAVRRHGGLAVADEVQVGYGRLGRWFWGFEQQAVVPDVVAVAKAMGNGHPLGAVVTSRAVAERYRTGGYFFSSTGGSPVSCVVGTTVLDVLADEDLQGNAARVGAHLKGRLQALRHPLLAAVHGEGLYLGVELVDGGAPATAATAAVCDRLRELGVIMQPTGDHLNVLKIKPPLCLDREGADFFVDALARVLSEGW